jgi:predicted SprT family Zn-dependent metalloprotease
MSDSSKYHGVLEKLTKIASTKWNLQTVLESKEEILHLSYTSSFFKKLDNSITPDMKKKFSHLKSVNVNTTPRRKHKPVSPHNSFFFSTYSIDNNTDNNSVNKNINIVSDNIENICASTNIFNAIYNPDINGISSNSSSNDNGCSDKKSINILNIAEQGETDEKEKAISSLNVERTEKIIEKKRVFMLDEDDDDDDDDDEEFSSAIKDVRLMKNKRVLLYSDDDDDDDNVEDDEGDEDTYIDNSISDEVKHYQNDSDQICIGNILDNNSAVEKTDDDDEYLSPMIYTAKKGLRKFVFIDSADDSSIDGEQAKEDIILSSSPSSVLIKKNNKLDKNKLRSNSSNCKIQSKIINLLSDSDDDEIDAQFSSLSDRLSRQANISINTKFDLIKTKSETTKLNHDNHTKIEDDLAVNNITNHMFTPSQWKKRKHVYTKSLYSEFNDTVFQSKLPKDLQIDWSMRLNKTAGLTYTDFKLGGESNSKRIRHARIELSTKVLTDLQRLKATLLHEMCHVAAWIIDGARKPPHGKEFKKWGKIAKIHYPDAAVTTCHSYEIHYKYQWKCSQENCTWKFGRHSNSLSIEKHRCGRCSSKIIFMGKFDSNGNLMKAKKVSDYQKFVKKANKKVRQMHPEYDFGEVQKHISKLWEKEKKKN